MKRIEAMLLVTGLLVIAPGYASGDGLSPATGAWQAFRPQFYGTREIGEVDEQFMHIDAPSNTPDPSATPIGLRFGKDAAGRIKQVRVIIDNNPSPLAATLDLTPGVPIDGIDLRVRIDRFTSVRAIAETTDGRLEMRSMWVNASGGCSAPPSASEGGVLGEIRFRASSDDKSLQVSIRHPNHSGFQIDPRTGDPIAPHYISHLRLSAGGQIVLEADTGISLSENPSVRIASDTPLAQPVVLQATDLPTRASYHASWSGRAETNKAAGGGSR